MGVGEFLAHFQAALETSGLSGVIIGVLIIFALIAAAKMLAGFKD